MTSEPLRIPTLGPMRRAARRRLPDVALLWLARADAELARLHADADALQAAAQQARADLRTLAGLLSQSQPEPPAAVPERDLITVPELARRLSLGETTARALVQAGAFGPPVQVGAAVRVSLHGLRRWLDAHGGVS